MRSNPELPEYEGVRLRAVVLQDLKSSNVILGQVACVNRGTTNSTVQLRQRSTLRLAVDEALLLPPQPSLVSWLVS